MGYDPKILLANQFAGFFTFDLFDLINLIPGGPLLQCTCLYLYSLHQRRTKPVFSADLKDLMLKGLVPVQYFPYQKQLISC